MDRVLGSTPGAGPSPVITWAGVQPEFAILVGSYEEADSATSVRRQLEALGYHAYQVATGSAARPAQQVLVGRYASEAQAREEERRLQGTPGFETVRIVTARSTQDSPFDGAQDRRQP